VSICGNGGKHRLGAEKLPKGPGQKRGESREGSRIDRGSSWRGRKDNDSETSFAQKRGTGTTVSHRLKAITSDREERELRVNSTKKVVHGGGRRTLALDCGVIQQGARPRWERISLAKRIEREGGVRVGLWDRSKSVSDVIEIQNQA